VSASIDNGILTLEFEAPKEEVKEVKKIDVS
jgi:hypothetical protein